ncbi:hypothetical protein AKO1_000374 [Acrasis kona]|uniref:N-acetyltransferase domain-containing protein n=1 Tax=Acrasis kona TaxID=1008807 RepID=A0AAW2ZB43_9EUKA
MYCPNLPSSKGPPAPRSYVFSVVKDQVAEPPYAERPVTEAPTRVGVVDDVKAPVTHHAVSTHDDGSPSLLHLVELDSAAHADMYASAIQLYSKTFTESYELKASEVTHMVQMKKYKMLAMLDAARTQVKAIAVIGDIPILDHTYCLLDYFVVDEKHRGGGFGAKFFNILVEYMRINSTHSIMLLECKDGLMKWYSRLGAMRCPIPSSVCDPDANENLAAVESYNTMDVVIREDGRFTAGDRLDQNRLKMVMNNMRQYLHSYCQCETKTVINEEGASKELLIWS